MAMAWLLSAGLLLAGCDQSGPATGNKSGGDRAAGLVQLDIASLDDVQRFVTDQKGKVVVLDLWSSSCSPCIRELPGLAKLGQEHPDDVVTVSLNLDFFGTEPPEKLRERAAKILAENGAAAKNFLSSTKDEDVYKNLHMISIPVVFVYDQTGNVAKRFDNDNQEYGKEGFTYKDHIAPLVKELVQTKGP